MSTYAEQKDNPSLHWAAEPTGQSGAGQFFAQYFVKTHELLHALEEGDTTPQIFLV